MESHPQNPEFRNNPENFHHANNEFWLSHHLCSYFLCPRGEDHQHIAPDQGLFLSFFQQIITRMIT